jgi:DNA adenine methylase
VSRTASFTTYTGAEFGEEEQRRLARLFCELSERGCLLMLSNSATPLARSLYSQFRIVSVLAARAINSKGNARGKIEELIVLNY